MIEILLKNNFNQHNSKSKNICFFSIIFSWSWLRKSYHLLRWKEYSWRIIMLIYFLKSPIIRKLTHNSPPILKSNSIVTNPNVPPRLNSFNSHLANALDDVEQKSQRWRSESLKKLELGEDEVVRFYEIVDGSGMRILSTQTLCNIKVHALVVDTINNPVDGTIYMTTLILFCPRI